MNQDDTGSTSATNVNAFRDNATTPQAQWQQLALLPQFVHWATSMGNPYAVQINSFPQQQQQDQNPCHPNGTAIATNIHGQYTVPQSSDASVALPANIAVDNFVRMVRPVGSFPDDDNVLVRALHQSEMNGTTYKQAIEGLHGVSHVILNLQVENQFTNCHVPTFVYCRQTTTLQVTGKIII